MKFIIISGIYECWNSGFEMNPKIVEVDGKPPTLKKILKSIGEARRWATIGKLSVYANKPHFRLNCGDQTTDLKKIQKVIDDKVPFAINFVENGPRIYVFPVDN